MLLVIDNFDSFTYNLVQALGELGAELMVRRNNQITSDQIRALDPAAIVISPGPGRPEDAGPSVEIIRQFGATVPILGVCLGHQAMAVAFGGSVVRAPHPVHGKTSGVDHDAQDLFEGVASPFRAARYHSLIVEERGLPPEIEVSARTGGRSARDGASPPRVAGVRRAVSSRIGVDRRRAEDARELSTHCERQVRCVRAAGLTG